jgi:hypothetical protein
MEPLLEVLSVAGSPLERVALDAVPVVEHREATPEVQVEAVAWTVELDADLLERLDDLVGEVPVAPGPPIQLLGQGELVAVELLYAIDHVQRLEARPSLVREVKVVDAKDVGFSIDNAHPERVSPEPRFGSFGRCVSVLVVSYGHVAYS